MDNFYEYAAGLFDGEGSVSVRRRDLYLTISLSVSSWDVLDEFIEHFGGCLSQNHLPRCPNLWTWRVHGKQALEFLQSVSPHTKIKKEKLLLALEIAETYGTGGIQVSPEIQIRRSELAERLLSLP